MKIGLGLLATATAAIVLAPPAQADSYSFQTPSGNIACMIGADGAACDIREHIYQPPPPPLCGQHLPWGSRFVLEPGKAGTIVCHGDTLRLEGEPTLDYGQTTSAGTVSCSSEAAGVRCTDSSTGHYFQVSRDSCGLG